MIESSKTKAKTLLQILAKWLHCTQFPPPISCQNPEFEIPDTYGYEKMYIKAYAWTGWKPGGRQSVQIGFLSLPLETLVLVGHNGFVHWSRGHKIPP